MYDWETWLLAIALIVSIAVVGFGFARLRRYWRHRRNTGALPQRDSIEHVQSSLLDQQRTLLASDLLSDASKLPAHEIEITRHALWMAMLLEAASDGSIDHREMRFVAELFGQMTGNKLDHRPVAEAAEDIRSDPKTALAEISKARVVSNASKEHVLAGAFLVSVSDSELADGEADCLGDIADALAINQRERKVIFESITKRLGL
jgi:uncharacterized membrane protein YebE (DUF533 family)